jgi:hypothetical protein
LSLAACSKKEQTELFKNHLEYFDLVGLKNYDKYQLILIVDSQGCESCKDSAMQLIRLLETEYVVKIIDLGKNTNQLQIENALIDSSRIYYSFPFSFDGLTVVDLSSQELHYPLFESTPIL